MPSRLSMLLLFFQMFIDYNLYGMNMLHVAALKFRQPAVEGNHISLL